MSISENGELSASQKLRVLKAAGEDYEWYPTTDQILAAFTDDLYAQAKTLPAIRGGTEIRYRKGHYD
jgi:hypothetical protein